MFEWNQIAMLGEESANAYQYVQLFYSHTWQHQLYTIYTIYARVISSYMIYEYRKYIFICGKYFLVDLLLLLFQCRTFLLPCPSSLVLCMYDLERKWIEKMPKWGEVMGRTKSTMTKIGNQSKLGTTICSVYSNLFTNTPYTLHYYPFLWHLEKLKIIFLESR